MNRTAKLTIAALCLLAANGLIFLQAWSLPQERVERKNTCEWHMTTGGVEVCR